ncbi:MAG: hypothetical protein H6912_05515 [Kordiimonadaceae bacterium]|nr:hypothetical protein [Kordiimonadaceae bacterium]
MYKYFVLIILTIFFIAGCSNYEKADENDLAGGSSTVILNGNKDKIYSFDFSTKSLKIIADLSGSFDGAIDGFKAMAPIDKDRIIVQSMFDDIRLYYPDKNIQKLIFKNANCPIYFHNKNRLLLNHFIEEEDGRKAYVIALNPDATVQFEKILMINEMTTNGCGLKLSESDALLYQSVFDDVKLVRYNVMTGDKTEIESNNCHPVMKLGGEEILCAIYNQNEKTNYTIAKIEGNKIVHLRNTKINNYVNMHNLYVKELNSILFYEPSEGLFTRTKGKVLIHNLNNGSSKLLIDDFHLDSGFVRAN